MLTLYCLHFLDGKKYVGQTTQPIKRRFSAHRTRAKNGMGCEVYKAWRSLGEPVLEVLRDDFLSQEDLKRAEIETIAEMGTVYPKGYNSGYGGDISPSLNPDVAKKSSQARIGKKQKTDHEMRSEKAKEMWEREGYRERVIESLKESWDDKRKEERSAFFKQVWKERKESGWVMSDEHKEKLRNRKFSEETRKKMSESAKKRGAPDIGEMGRAKLSERTKAMWADPEKKAARVAKLKEAWARRKMAKKQEGLE